MLDLEIALFFSRLGMYLISPWMWKLKKKIAEDGFKHD